MITCLKITYCVIPFIQQSLKYKTIVMENRSVVNQGVWVGVMGSLRKDSLRRSLSHAAALHLHCGGDYPNVYMY